MTCALVPQLTHIGVGGGYVVLTYFPQQCLMNLTYTWGEHLRRYRWEKWCKRPPGGGWGHVVPGWVKERGVLGIIYFGSIDTALCMMS